MSGWPEPVERVAAVLRDSGIDARVEEFHEGTPTARAAAKAVGAGLNQIVKSLLFICDGRPTLALVPGDRRADETKVAAAPFPAPAVNQVLIQPELLAHEQVWIGAGSERHMVGISPVDLVRVTSARAGDLSET